MRVPSLGKDGLHFQLPNVSSFFFFLHFHHPPAENEDSRLGRHIKRATSDPHRTTKAKEAPKRTTHHQQARPSALAPRQPPRPRHPTTPPIPSPHRGHPTERRHAEARPGAPSNSVPDGVRPVHARRSGLITCTKDPRHPSRPSRRRAGGRASEGRGRRCSTPDGQGSEGRIRRPEEVSGEGGLGGLALIPAGRGCHGWNTTAPS